MRRIEIVLPFPPTVNHYLGRKGRNYFPSAETKAFRAAVDNTLIDAGLFRIEPMTRSIEAWVDVYFPRRGSDLHNREKVLFDVLQGRLYVNDKQICRSHWCRRYDKDVPRVHMILQEIDHDE